MLRSEEKLREPRKENQLPVEAAGESERGENRSPPAVFQQLSPFSGKALEAEPMWAKANVSMETVITGRVFPTKNSMVTSKRNDINFMFCHL